MRRIVLLVCMLPLSMACNATSCISDGKADIERSDQYLNEVKIDVDKSDSSFDVSISLPLNLENLNLASLTLVRRGVDGKEDDFMMPLNVTPKNGRTFAWYMISRDLSESNVIEAVYGVSCGISIRYKLDYKNESLESVTIEQ